MMVLRAEDGRFLKSYDPTWSTNPAEALLYDDAPCSSYQAALGEGTYRLTFVPVLVGGGGKVVTL